MGQYYYAATSLPQLFFDAEHFPSLDSFMKVCMENLSTGDMRAILEAKKLAESESVKPFGRGISILGRWSRWNASLKADIAVLRAQGLGKESDSLSDVERVIGTEEIAREAFNQESPLSAEEIIERKRWTMLDELEVGHYFDLQKLIVYMLRLTILERKAKFTAEKGTDIFNRVYNEIITTEQHTDNPGNII